MTKNVVVIGGGTGSFTVLKGLKKHDVHITSVVTMFDSGGTSGVLRDEFGILPPGDARQSLVALAEDGDNILRELFNYRIREECSLHNQSMGNLFLLALTRITGSEAEAIKKAAKILNVKGTVLPVSVNKADVCVEYEDGSVVVGEKHLDSPSGKEVKIRRIFLSTPAYLCEDARLAIQKADLIVLGPGDLYGSLVPNLLVEGMREALQLCAGKKVYVCNLMTKYDQTTNQASEFVREIMRYGFSPDVVICSSTTPDSTQVKRYEGAKQIPVVIDDAVHSLGPIVVCDDLMSKQSLVRHDPDVLGKVLMDVMKG